MIYVAGSSPTSMTQGPPSHTSTTHLQTNSKAQQKTTQLLQTLRLYFLSSRSPHQTTSSQHRTYQTNNVPPNRLLPLPLPRASHQIPPPLPTRQHRRPRRQSHRPRLQRLPTRLQRRRAQDRPSSLHPQRPRHHGAKAKAAEEEGTGHSARCKLDQSRGRRTVRPLRDVCNCWRRRRRPYGQHAALHALGDDGHPIRPRVSGPGALGAVVAETVLQTTGSWWTAGTVMRPQSVR
jgi:hypothetical protein